MIENKQFFTFIDLLICSFRLQNCPFDKDCTFKHLSCRYLSHLNSTVIKTFYPDTGSAVEAVRLGHAWGAIHFTENFTDSLVARMALGKYLLISCKL